MSKNDSDLATAVKALAREARHQMGPAPTPEELVAYHDGGLSEAERERLEERLAVDPEAARVVLDLDAFPGVEPVDASRRLTPEQSAAQWRALRRELEQSDLIPKKEPAPVVRPRFAAAGTARALAAVLLTAVVGLLFRLAYLESRIDRLTGPQPNPLVSDLFPMEGSGPRDGRQQPVEVPALAEDVVMQLFLSDLRPFDDYGVELVRAGEVSWRQLGLRRQAAGGFSVRVPVTWLPVGPCEIRLFGVTESREEVLATYVFTIEHTPGD